MNRSYVIVPIVLLAIFGFFYWQYMQTASQKEAQRQELVAQEKAAADAKKRDAEDKARKDAEKRDLERQAEEHRKAVEKRAKYDADIQKIRDELNKFTAQANDYAK